MILRVKDSADKHYHDNIEDEMRSLQTENDDLQSKYAKLAHEHNNLLYEYQNMNKRLESFDVEHNKLISLIAGRPGSINLPISADMSLEVEPVEDGFKKLGTGYHVGPVIETPV